MSDDVVDIRKRIEEMRNEVSAAVSGREQAQATRALGELADIAISSNMEPGDVNGWKKQSPSDTMVHTHRSIDNALRMPAFTLNVRNQISNRLLMAVIGIQLLTNILLILMVWMKISSYEMLNRPELNTNPKDTAGRRIVFCIKLTETMPPMWYNNNLDTYHS